MHNMLCVAGDNTVANMTRLYEARGVKKEYHEKFKPFRCQKVRVTHRGGSCDRVGDPARNSGEIDNRGGSISPH